MPNKLWVILLVFMNSQAIEMIPTLRPRMDSKPQHFNCRCELVPRGDDRVF